MQYGFGAPVSGSLARPDSLARIDYGDSLPILKALSSP